MKMTYEQARTYIAGVSKTGSVYGLESIRRLMYKLGDCQKALSVIHIAGTNGKGSVGAFLESGLIEAGYSVGRYTSPAVFDPLEVWRINRMNITEEDYAGLVSQVKDACDALVAEGLPHPTVFEVETAMAFLYFYRKKCDYVLLEVGMGGELDATNLIETPLCSVITSISMDHMQFLGDTLEKIATAKAGIIKENCPVATVRQKPEVMRVLRKRADECHAPLTVADVEEQVSEVLISPEKCTYRCAGIGIVELQMTASYQVENSLLAMTVMAEILHIPEETALSGLKKTVWQGRFERIGTEPSFFIDGAHNEDAAEKLYETLQNHFTNKRIIYIIGVLADKEHEKMLRKLLPLAARVYTVTPQNPRALDAGQLAKEAERLLADEAERQLADEAERQLAVEAASGTQCAVGNTGMPEKTYVPVQACTSVQIAVHAALGSAGADGVILAFGSLSYLDDVKKAFLRERKGK